MLELNSPTVAIVALLVSATVFGGVWLFLEKRRHQPKGDTRTVLVANSVRIRQNPEYQKALNKIWVTILTATVVALTIATVSAVGAGRLINISVEQPEKYNRDIMLCLDISGSMEAPNTQIIDTFLSLAEDFRGERIGLTVFNSTPATVFPLTDDYEYVKANLEKVKHALNEAYIDPQNRDVYTLFASTMEGNGSSLVGDGLYGCVLGFEFVEYDTERSRSIIIASDNVIAGNELVTIIEAAEAAHQNNVAVYGISPSGNEGGLFIPPSATEEFAEATEMTGGHLNILASGFSANRIVAEISSTEATRMESSPIYIKTDISHIIIPLIGAAYLAHILITRRGRI